MKNTEKLIEYRFSLVNAVLAGLILASHLEVVPAMELIYGGETSARYCNINVPLVAVVVVLGVSLIVCKNIISRLIGSYAIINASHAVICWRIYNIHVVGKRSYSFNIVYGEYIHRPIASYANIISGIMVAVAMMAIILAIGYLAVRRLDGDLSGVALFMLSMYCTLALCHDTIGRIITYTVERGLIYRLYWIVPWPEFLSMQTVARLVIALALQILVVALVSIRTLRRGELEDLECAMMADIILHGVTIALARFLVFLVPY